MMKMNKECEPGPDGLPIESYVNFIDEITMEALKGHGRVEMVNKRKMAKHFFFFMWREKTNFSEPIGVHH